MARKRYKLDDKAAATLRKMRLWQQRFQITGDGVTMKNMEDGCAISIGQKPSPRSASPPPPGQIFRVALASTSGSAGTQTTASSWVYTVTSLSGFQLATGATPERGRRNGALTAATKGYGYFDATGTFVLAEAWEGTSTGHC